MAVGQAVKGAAGLQPLADGALEVQLAAVAAAPGRRILLPMSSCGVLVAGTAGLRMEELLKDAVELAAKEVDQ